MMQLCSVCYTIISDRCSAIFYFISFFLHIFLSVSRIIARCFFAATVLVWCILSFFYFAKEMKRVLVVLGGTGYVGTAVIRRALACDIGGRLQVVAVSRRGVPSSASAVGGDLIDNPSVTWVKADLTKQENLESVFRDARVIDGDASLVGVVHALGVLFDSSTYGAGSLNRIISGSESVPCKDTPSDGTYERINRDTALHAIKTLSGHKECAGTRFVYVSAAEAGWPDVSGGLLC